MRVEAKKTATAGREPFVVMAKPVGPLCNLACGYCYYLETGRFYENPHRFKMSDEMLEAYVREYIAASPGPVVAFTWHGGEPTLAGLDFFELAVTLQKRYLPQGWSCWNNLQTNGILLDDKWCAFLAENRFDVGLSLDGTQVLHDEYRKDHDGRGTFERVVSSLRRLQAHGIQPDLLCTVTSSIAKEPVAVYRMLRDLDTGWIQFIPIVRRDEVGRLTPDSVTGEDYGRFLCGVFDEWIGRDLGHLDVQLFAETMLVWSGGTTNVCQMAKTCGRVLVLEHDGGVYSCDHFVEPVHRIGSLESSALGDIIDSPEQRRFGSDKQDGLTSQCRACPWLSVCNGGCPKDRFALSKDGESGHSVLCKGLCEFFAHAERPLKRVVELKAKGLRPEAIMAELRAASLPEWKGIGRNDPCPCGSGKKAKNCCWARRDFGS